MCNGGTKPFYIGHITTHIIGYPASAIGDEFIPVNHCNFNIRVNAPKPAGHLGTQCHSADNQYFFGHRSLLNAFARFSDGYYLEIGMIYDSIFPAWRVSGRCPRSDTLKQILDSQVTGGSKLVGL